MERAGTPEAADFALTLTPEGGALHLVPPIGVLGVGCRRGTTAERLEEAFSAFCASSGLSPAAVSAAASIDLKRGAGACTVLRSPRLAHHILFGQTSCGPCREQFTPSAFVAGVTGVDNVCERAAAKASGGALLLPKTAGGRRRKIYSSIYLHQRIIKHNKRELMRFFSVGQP